MSVASHPASYSAVNLPRTWFVACLSTELGKRPLARVVQGTPLALFRAVDGSPVALVDRCPHRNVPLSEGQVEPQGLRCAYHGWCFDKDGACVDIPGSTVAAVARARNVARHPTVEQQGFIWVSSSPGEPPAEPPYRFPHLEAQGYSHARQQFRVAATMHAVMENTLDVPHTAYLHGGLFRTRAKAHDIEVVVRRHATWVEAEFLGEPRPKGLAGKLLAPGGGLVQHFDRFLLPSVAQVEYRLGPRSHLVTTSVHTPVGPLDTRIYAVVSFRLPLPAWLVRPFLTPVALHIFKQDARMLALQTMNLERFGAEQYASSELDVLGPHILRLLRQAERGERPPEGVDERRVTMRV